MQMDSGIGMRLLKSNTDFSVRTNSKISLGSPLITFNVLITRLGILSCQTRLFQPENSVRWVSRAKWRFAQFRELLILKLSKTG
jgi:hypothetical protein